MSATCAELRTLARNPARLRRYADVLDNKEKNQWLQFNAGVRSQRFALIVEDGVVRAAAPWTQQPTPFGKATDSVFCDRLTCSISWYWSDFEGS